MWPAWEPAGKQLLRKKTNADQVKFHQICSSVFHRTLRPSGTPLYFSPTRPQKNCWPNSLQQLSSLLSLTCSSQVLCCLQILLLFSQYHPQLFLESPETERFVGKLRRAGSLADYCCMPGTGSPKNRGLYVCSVKFSKLFLGQFSFAFLVYSCDGATKWKVPSKHWFQAQGGRQPFGAIESQFGLFVSIWNDFHQLSCAGIGHGHFFDASLACHHRFHQHFKLAIEKYLME